MRAYLMSLAVAAPALLLGLAACNNTPTLSTAKANEVGAAAVTEVVTDGIVVEKGATVDCRATMDNGSTQSATRTLTDGSGGFNIDTGGPGS